MKKISILLFFILLLSLGNGAYAADMMEASLISETAELTISGSMAEKKTLISVRILPENVAEDSVTPAQTAEKNYVFKTIRTDENGGFGEKIILPDSYKSGVYKIYVNLGAKEITKDIVYINFSQVGKLVSKLNQANGKTDFINKFVDTDIQSPQKNYEILVLSDSEYALYGEKIFENLYNMKPQGGYSVESFVSEYKRAYFLNIQNRDFSEDRVKEYAAYFNLNFDEEYKNLRSDEKNAFSDNLKKEYSTLKPANTVFWDSLILARLSNSTSYVEFKNVFLKYQSYINPSVTYYNSLPSDYDKNNVFSQMYEIKTQITSVALAKSAFENAAESIYNSLSLSSGSTSGGFGGGGGGGYSSNAVTDSYEVSDAKTDKQYSDVTSHWGKDYIYDLSEKGIINGFSDGTFKPDNCITRAETVKMLAVMLDIPQYGAECFSDVKASDWFYPYVGAMYNSGIVKGDDGKFNPDQYITRQDIAVLLYRSFKDKLAGTEKAMFSDKDKISDYALKAVEALYDCGIITGYNGQFNPLGSTTRGEAAAMFSRILKLVEEVR